ncbi:undecaprenyl-diphosphate phosphatase [Adhaeretor mobilis]|uniref:Undecaprenyl-diphosphatase n=1 Tax=Adhaeretor mobilis TaxID=1930276 RepID=A0A517MTD9_9BACT|nr:undecaprenyl-diphosphate phosphatase [Adhaeretor mobilis]QDS98047.1 Undecaprenyl-diphosphatase [Adhaeretor mobilis]
MTTWEIILLAIVQGLTEFLPVSSSGHLVVANALLEAFGSEPVQDLVEVSVVLHLGTLAAVLIFYRKEIVGLLSKDSKAIMPLIVATVPAVIIGLTIKKGLPEHLEKTVLESPLLAGFMFPITAVALWWISRQQPGEGEYTELTPGKALKIGLLQAFALLPGISRSGATIVGGLAMGLKREAAATFAFLMAIPAIGGGGLLEGLEAYQEGTTGTPIGTLLIGFIISMIVGLAALKLVIHWVKAGRLAMFAYYLVPLGVAVVAWRLTSGLH